jgi:hypothetical protein
MTRTHWDSQLESVLDSLRKAEGRAETPSHVEAAVLAAWDRAHSSRPAARAGWGQRVAAAAAAVTIAGGHTQLGRALERAVRTSTVADKSDTLLVVGEPILQGEPVRVVRMRIPASTLIGLGVRTSSDVAQVDVDVIVGEDGVARAIRVGM